jgi:4-amino-4-deoxy-L-arabinose transferase-like glycosyltransferase
MTMVDAPARPASGRAALGRVPLVRSALAAVLLLAGVLYAFGMSGYGNTYYAAAVRSGATSWKAFFFGSLDSASFITVDKPPMALWVQELFARVFGFGSWSLLLPSALMGVAAVGVLYATVRRVFGPVAGLIAALVMTLTPITVAINRDNNPDTLLVLLLVLAAWACQRYVASGRPSWLLASAFFLGCGFNTKMLQAYLLLPALFFVALLFGPSGWLRRVLHLLSAGAVLAVSSFWWMVVVDVIPAGSRPYIGGSTNDTVWDLVIGYNGLGRVTGGSGQGLGRGGQGMSFAGASGVGRLFNDIVGGQIAWLLPFAVLALVAGIVLTRRGPRLSRAALVLWGGWLVVHFTVFSFSNGTMHPYYTTALAPAIGALTGIGGVLLFDAYRQSRVWSGVLPVGVLVTGVWAFVLLRRSPSWHSWLAWTVLVVSGVAAVSLVGIRLGFGSQAPGGSYEPGSGGPDGGARRTFGVRRPTVVVAVLGLLAGLAGPAAYAASAAAGRSNGTNPLAGPASGGFGPGGPGGFGMGGPGGPGGRMPEDVRKMMEEGRFPGGGRPPGGMPGASDASGRRGGAPGSGGFGGGFGGPGGEVSSQLISYLQKHRDGATWLVAVARAPSASSIILQTGQPVIAMGGFTGNDPAMTVPRLQAYVKAGKLHYVMTGGGGPGGRGDDAVTSWVEKNCTAVQPSEYGASTSSAQSDQNAQSVYRCG